MRIHQTDKTNTMKVSEDENNNIYKKNEYGVSQRKELETH